MVIALHDMVVLIAGVVCAGVGGELFVRGAVGLAQWARVAPGIVGATVAAFATSSPELSVSISAAMTGKPEIALGDALGSNVVNVSLVLALALVVSGMRSSRESLRRDFPVAMLIPPATFFLSFDGEFTRSDGILMLGLFVAWLAATIRDARNQRLAAAAGGSGHRGWQVALLCAAGLAFLIVAGKLIVDGARGIALTLGIGEFIVGATVVALGTSAPELATAVIAKLRGHDEVGLGTILGSNIFNGIFIIAIAAIIHPIVVPRHDVALTLGFGFAALALVYPRRDGFIPWWRGMSLLVLYAIYLVSIALASGAA